MLNLLAALFPVDTMQALCPEILDPRAAADVGISRLPTGTTGADRIARFAKSARATGPSADR